MIYLYVNEYMNEITQQYVKTRIICLNKYANFELNMNTRKTYTYSVTIWSSNFYFVYN